MQIGIPKEIKDGEGRVAATPESVRVFADAGHEVFIESGAGIRSGFEDACYEEAGARITLDPDEVYACPLVIKVKELQPVEYLRLRPGCILAGYQQLARDPALLEAVLDRRVSCFAYDGFVAEDGTRPLLAPMSTIAGLLSAQIASWALQRREGPLSGSGVLLPALEGVARARVLIVGEGTVGAAAARAFLSLGCRVTVLGLVAARLKSLETQAVGWGSGVLRTALSTRGELEAGTAEADVVVGAVSVPGFLTPKLINRSMLRAMRPGSAYLEIGIDMGGIADTARQTKLSDPMYLEEGVLHYCVPNIPALVPRTATQALAAATLPVLRLLASRGLAGALGAIPELHSGLLVHDGRIVHPGLATDTDRPFTPYA